MIGLHTAPSKLTGLWGPPINIRAGLDRQGPGREHGSPRRAGQPAHSTLALARPTAHACAPGGAERRRYGTKGHGNCPARALQLLERRKHLGPQTKERLRECARRRPAGRRLKVTKIVASMGYPGWQRHTAVRLPLGKPRKGHGNCPESLVTAPRQIHTRGRRKPGGYGASRVQPQSHGNCPARRHTPGLYAVPCAALDDRAGSKARSRKLLSSASHRWARRSRRRPSRGLSRPPAAPTAGPRGPGHAFCCLSWQSNQSKSRFLYP